MLAVGGFWLALAFVFIAFVAAGMGRQAWHELRHEIRRRKSL